MKGKLIAEQSSGIGSTAILSKKEPMNLKEMSIEELKESFLYEIGALQDKRFALLIKRSKYWKELLRRFKDLEAKEEKQK